MKKAKLIYDPVSGHVFREFKNHSRQTGLAINSAGYHTVWDGYAVVPVHQLACRQMGIKVLPGFVIDHINRVRTDNRWCNLRVVPESINRHNRSQTSGRALPTGIRVTTSGKFQARIRVNRRLISLGSYPTESAALSAYNQAKEGQVNG